MRTANLYQKVFHVKRPQEFFGFFRFSRETFGAISKIWCFLGTNNNKMRKIGVESSKIPLPTVRVPAVLAEKRTFCKNQPPRASITTTLCMKSLSSEQKNGIFMCFQAFSINSKAPKFTDRLKKVPLSCDESDFRQLNFRFWRGIFAHFL